LLYFFKAVCSAAEHKLYTECDAYQRNQKTCENPEGPFAIADICMPGCICEEGYVQDSEGNCILPESCPVIQRKKLKFLFYNFSNALNYFFSNLQCS
jgi:hypothetical protein